MDEFVKKMADGWNLNKKRTNWAENWGIPMTRPNWAKPVRGPEKMEHMADLKKRGYVTPIEKNTVKNNDFRKVLYTAKHTQLVLMSLNPGEEIGFEIHYGTDQFFRVESGVGMSVINGIRRPIRAGDAVVVPSGAKHNIINTGRVDLKLYTLYSPPHHADKVIRRTRAAAINPANAEHFAGKTTE